MRPAIKTAIAPADHRLRRRQRPPPLLRDLRVRRAAGPAARRHADHRPQLREPHPDAGAVAYRHRRRAAGARAHREHRPRDHLRQPRDRRRGAARPPRHRSKAAVLGHSLGGGVALELAVNHPDRVSAIVPISASVSKDGMHPDLLRPVDLRDVARSCRRRRTSRTSRGRTSGCHRTRSSSTRSSCRWAGWTPTSRAGPTSSWPGSRCPVLIVQGDNDFTTVAHAGVMLAKIPGSALAVIPATPHMQVTRRDDDPAAGPRAVLRRPPGRCDRRVRPAAGPPHTLRRMAAVPFYGATGKFTWRMGAVVLGAQSLIVFLGALVARTLAVAQGDGVVGDLPARRVRARGRCASSPPGSCAGRSA